MTPKTTQADVEALLRFLGPNWVMAEELRYLANKRVLRAIANASKGRIISSDKGYRATAFATQDEIRHCIRRLMHQALEMDKRAKEITDANWNKNGLLLDLAIR